jgi:cell division protein FtsL
MTLPGSRKLFVWIPILWICVLASAAGTIYTKHRARELFVELERVNRERDRLEIEWGRLQLEQSAWSTHAFVENVAASNLGMRAPPPKQIEVIAP